MLNVIHGDAAVGVRATDRPDVDRISFTGSVGVGASILSQAAPHITNVTLELGGKSANIVLPGFEFTEWAVRTMHARYARNAGQGCMAPTRILIERHRVPDFIDVTRRVYKSLQVGDPWDLATDVGPLIRPEHRASVEGYVERALAAGAETLAGGGRPDTDRGWYMNPALLGNVAANSEIAMNELFGPVAVLLPYDSVDEAVAIANGTRYGLAAYVSGPDLDEARTLASRLRAACSSTAAAAHARMRRSAGSRPAAWGGKRGSGASASSSSPSTCSGPSEPVTATVPAGRPDQAGQKGRYAWSAISREASRRWVTEARRSAVVKRGIGPVTVTAAVILPPRSITGTATAASPGMASMLVE